MEKSQVIAEMRRILEESIQRGKAYCNFHPDSVANMAYIAGRVIGRREGYGMGAIALDCLVQFEALLDKLGGLDGGEGDITKLASILKNKMEFQVTFTSDRSGTSGHVDLTNPEEIAKEILIAQESI